MAIDFLKTGNITLWKERMVSLKKLKRCILSIGILERIGMPGDTSIPMVVQR